MSNYDPAVQSDQAVLAQIAAQCRRQRLDQNMTQQQLADRAGLGVATLRRFESGEGNLSLLNLVALLRALGQLDRLAALVSSTDSSPMARLRDQGAGVYDAPARQRARPDAIAEPDDAPWQWADDGADEENDEETDEKNEANSLSLSTNHSQEPRE